MKKLAIFVEGQTEAVFVEALIRQMVDQKKIRIQVFQMAGGKKAIRRMRMVRKSADEPSHVYYVQIVESMNDERVRSDIEDRYESLTKAGFEGIIGMRDVYPAFSYADVPKLRMALKNKIKTKPVDPLFVLAIMEIEAWFLAEHTHFPKIHPSLTTARIKTEFGFDPSLDDMQIRPCPHEDLHNIYQLEGHMYNKRLQHVETVVQVLDYARLYLELPSKIPDLSNLVAALDEFFT